MLRSKFLQEADSYFKPNLRLSETQSSLIRAITKVQYTGSLSRISLGLGELNFPMPKKAQDANALAIKEGKTGYTDNAGLDELRTAVAKDFEKSQGVVVEKDNVIITSGSTGALYIAFEAFLNPGDEVLIPSLYYPLYDMHPRKWGAKVLEYGLTSEFDIDIKDLASKITPKTKLIVLSSPSNPTGQIVSSSAMEKIARLIENHPQAFILTDEIYSACIFDGAVHKSIASFTDRVVVIDGLSKRASQTGKRVGWLIAPKTVIETMEKSQQQTYVCAPTDSQYAALPVLNGECEDDLRHYQEELGKRKAIMGKLLKKIPGIKFAPPKGAFYYFIDVSHYGDSMSVATRLIKDVNVVTVPGVAFGLAGNNYLRLSYAGDITKTQEGLKRMKGAFEKWQ